MRKGLLVCLLAVAAASLGLIGAGQASSTDPPRIDPGANLALLAAIPEPTVNTLDPPGFFEVKPQEFDPGKTNLVQANWLNGVGCPTDAFTAVFPSGTAPYTDTACATGDAKDQHNEGLLLVKTGPTNNFASAVAELNKVKGITLTELGYDIRKSGGSGGSPLGSHCGAGAPRFNVVTADGVTHFLGCNSPPGTPTGVSTGWVRLRWDAAALLGAFPPIMATDVVKRILIVFDEGTDAGPDSFGAAFLDNIDVNNSLVGHGATDAG
jgi:hypothetical protein